MPHRLLPLVLCFSLVLFESVYSQELLWEAGQREEVAFPGFSHILDADFLPAGNVVVLDNRANEVSLFSGDGKFLGFIGRVGEGPGEFRNVSSLVTTYHQILISDEGLRRIVTFDHRGEPVETSRFTEPALSMWMATRIGIGNSASVVRQLDELGFGSPPPSVREHTSFVAGGGRKADTLFSIGMGAIGAWEGGVLVLALNAERQGASDLAGDSVLAAAFGPERKVRWWRINSETVTNAFEHDLPVHPRRMTRADCQRHASDLPEDLPTPKELLCPPFESVIDKMVTDRVGRALIRLRENGTEDWDWKLFEMSQIIEVEFPDDFFPRGISGCKVVGHIKDEYDVPILQVWRLASCEEK